MYVEPMNYLLAIIGTWIITDGVYSWSLYVNAPSYDGTKKQTFFHDHWVRLLRIVLGILTITIGYYV